MSPDAVGIVIEFLPNKLFLPVFQSNCNHTQVYSMVAYSVVAKRSSG